VDLSGAILQGKYRLVRLIGSGGMGDVYEAAPAAGPGRHAIKILRPEFLEDPGIVARFLEEGRTCERLVHPSIVRVVETACAEDGSPFLVMEYLDGVPLSAYTRRGGRVPLAQAATIVQGLLAGLGAAHAQGIVHRDLKPDNVILARDPAGQFQPKILDFGIAKVMDAAGGMGQKTATGMLLGTPAYMSPEQIRNAKAVDHRTDLFSAGVLLYEMLTGRVAFPAPTEYARLSAVLNDTPTPLAQIDPALARVAPVVERAMSKDRDARFASALDMARALGAALGAETAALSAPLSHLPDVPSVFGPPASGSAPSGPPPATAPTLATPAADGLAFPKVGPSGTLASGASRQIAEPPPNVVVVNKGTLPSQDLPMFGAVSRGVVRVGGVSWWIVVVLVLVALSLGLGVGFAVGRMR
jgi:serine/threonine-protein kinase